MKTTNSNNGTVGEAPTKQMTSNSGNKKKVNVDTDQSQFPTHLDFYNNLFIHSNCQPPHGLTEITGPLKCSLLKKAIIDFGTNYRTDGGLNYEPTKIPFDKVFAYEFIKLLKDYSEQKVYGLVFHYGYDVDTNRIVYILSRGKVNQQEKVQFCPFEIDVYGQKNQYYLLLDPHNNGPFKSITADNFSTLKTAYLSNMKFKDGGTFRDVNAVAGHPLMAYHDPKELYAFYQEYEKCANIYLYICHGSLKHENMTAPMHTPCFVFGSDTHFFPLDNFDYTLTGLNYPYRLKALDIGRLCPPNCNQVSPDCSSQ